MDFKILHYNEGIFNIDTEYVIPKDKDNVEVTLCLKPVLKYSDELDIIGCQLTLQYSIEEHTVIKYGYIVVIEVAGWRQHIKTLHDKQDFADSTFNIWGAVVNYGRGVLEEKLKDTQFKSMTIPEIPKEQLAKSLQLDKK